jgi:hypothetical protein
MKNACENLNIHSKHFVHFGRSVGLVTGEFKELTGDELRNLGNWNVDTMEDVYSCKIPFQTLRVMAGHPKERGLNFLPRGGIIPTEELSKTIFPFIESSFDILSQSPNAHPTAHEFLNILLQFRIILLQDVAELILLKKQHILFQLPPFNTPSFQSFVNEIDLHRKSAIHPQESRLQSIAPDVSRRLDSIQCNLSEQAQEMESGFHAMQEKMQTIEQNMATGKLIANFVRHIGNSLNQFEIEQPTTINQHLVQGHESQASEVHLELSNAVPEECPAYTLSLGHSSVSSMYNEWFGLGKLKSYFVTTCSIVSQTIVTGEFSFEQHPGSGFHLGGIDALEKKYKNRWRALFNGADEKRFSRLKYIISRVLIQLKTGKSLDTTLEKFDKKMGKKGISTFYNYLKANPMF